MPDRSVEEYLNSLPEDVKRNWPTPFRLSSGSTEDILTRGAEAFRWHDRWRGWRVPTFIDGPTRRGVGVGTGCHVCGVEFEENTSAIVRINPDGSATVCTAAGRQGQGSETTLAQVAAEALGLPFDHVDCQLGDTDASPGGHGSLASNTMYRIGFAVKAAALDARDQLLAIAAREVFKAPAKSLTVASGLISNPNGESIPVENLMNSLRSDTLGQATTITGRSSATPMPPSTTFARHFACAFVEVEVDVELGTIRIIDYLAGLDSGTVMNPGVLKNQALGGALCGAGYALCECMVFDDSDGRVRNANWMDYKLLRTLDFPSQVPVIFGNSYDPVGPFGARAAGEAPTIAPGPAISQAVYNALEGVWVDMPMTPDRLLTALENRL